MNLDKQRGWKVGVGANSAADSTVTTEVTTIGGPNANPRRTLEILQESDRNRVTDTVIVSAHTGVAGASEEKASLSIDVADANLLPAVTAKVVDDDGVVLANQPKSLKEGEKVKIAVMPLDLPKSETVAPFAAEELTVELMPSGEADSRDYRPLGKIKIPMNARASEPVELIIENDEDVGAEMLVFDAVVSGNPQIGTETRTSTGVLSLGIEDATTKNIWTKSQDDAYPKITAAIEAGAGDEGPESRRVVHDQHERPVRVCGRLLGQLQRRIGQRGRERFGVRQHCDSHGRVRWQRQGDHYRHGKDGIVLVQGRADHLERGRRYV